MSVQAIKVSFHRLEQELAELRRRLANVEMRQVVAVHTKADQLSRELEIDSQPLQAVNTSVERRVNKKVEEFRLARRIDDITSVEFDRLRGVLRVVYGD